MERDKRVSGSGVYYQAKVVTFLTIENIVTNAGILKCSSVYLTGTWKHQLKSHPAALSESYNVHFVQLSIKMLSKLLAVDVSLYIWSKV